MSWTARWRPVLRIAWRDAWRHKGRSAVVLFMVALPVLAVVALDTLARTADVSAAEGLARRLGASDAQVQFSGASRIDQDPTSLAYSTTADTFENDLVSDPGPVHTLAALLPQGSRVQEVVHGSTTITTDLGRAFADAIEIDLSDPMTAGLYRLDLGRLPQSADEVLVSDRLADRGFEDGSQLTLSDGSVRTVVGRVRWTDMGSTARLVVGPPGSVPMTDDATRWWLVDAPAAVTWSQVKALNRHGFFALSREVVMHPPAPSEVTYETGNGGLDGPALAVIGMVAAMALLEIVLLAGPAFAVGIRRQERALALLTATGGRPRDVRRVVLGSGLVLGAAASALGVVGGLAAARIAQPGAQHFSTELFGPFQVSVRDLLVIAVCGLLSAVLAAVAPAFSAARQDVVAVLAGRRGQTRAPLWSPVAGALLLVAGTVAAVLGATRPAGGETYITGGAILAIVGMVLLIPLAVAHLGRVARVLPLPARFAVRDAARHRSRTAPAVAAVAATVAGVVALGIGSSSDAAQNKALHTPRAPLGAAVVTSYSDHPVDWRALESIVRRQLPGAHVTHLLGVPDGAPDSAVSPAATSDASGTLSIDVTPVRPTGAVADSGLSWSSNFGASVLVGAKTFDAMGLEISGAQRDRAERALATGAVVLFANADLAPHVAQATVRRQHTSADGTGDPTTLREITLPAVAITAPGTEQPAAAVVPESVAARLGFTATTTSLLIDGVGVSTADEDALGEALQGVDANALVGVERGFHDNSTAVALLLLGCVGGVLVVGGTMTATFLALSDARPDFATMGAIGAAPRTRRAVAASYAATIGFAGAVLGALVGFVPGIAVTYPLTSDDWAKGSIGVDGTPVAGHFLDVPWLLVTGLVVGLPLLVATVVAATSRSRLPMVSRLS